MAGNAVLRIGYQPHRRKPDVKTERAVFKDGTDTNAELSSTALAFPETARTDEANILTAATRAGNAVRPSHRDGELETGLRVAEIANRFKKGFGEIVVCFHDDYDRPKLE